MKQTKYAKNGNKHIHSPEKDPGDTVKHWMLYFLDQKQTFMHTLESIWNKTTGILFLYANTTLLLQFLCFLDTMLRFVKLKLCVSGMWVCQYHYCNTVQDAGIF